MKWALALAAFAGRGRLPGSSGGLLQQGTKLLTSSPELTKLTDEMKGRLVDAGKAAAVAAVSSKIDSLSEGLRERSETMRAAGTGLKGGAAAGAEENVEDEHYRDEGERYRDEGERYRDEERAADSRPRRRRDEDVEGRDQRERVPAPRGESDRDRASRPSRSRERAAADDRESHPSRSRGQGNGAETEPAGSGPRGGGRTRPRSTTSRTGGDNE